VVVVVIVVVVVVVMMGCLYIHALLHGLFASVHSVLLKQTKR
jgi:hypothetical protein